MIYTTPEHDVLREQVARFLEREVEPHGLKWEEQGYTPKEVLRKMGQLGWLGMTYPSEYGGAETDFLTSVVFQEALSMSTFGGFIVTVLVHTDMASPHLIHAGNPEQIKAYLPGAISGELITAVGISEPDAGSDVAGIRTTARRDGGDWVLNGSKMFITNGVNADLYFIAAKTDSEAKGSRGISMFIVEKGTPGFTVGRKLDKQGWCSSDTAELIFDNCRVPAANLLGEENQGFYAVMSNFQIERIALGAMAIGHALTALRLTTEWTKQRKAFGGVLYDKQVIRQRLAMLASKTEAARALLYHCAWLVNEKKECVREVSMLKALTGELVNEVVYSCFRVQ